MTDAATAPAVLALGANLGDARATMRAAVAGLAARSDVTVLAVSGLYRTAPVGGPDQPDYLNAVVLVATPMPPTELLELAHELEAAAGRERDVRWGPRTLDVDIVDIEGFTSAEAALSIPHPRAHERAFVLAPWAEVAPDWMLTPAGGPTRSVREWRDRCADQAVVRQEDQTWVR